MFQSLPSRIGKVCKTVFAGLVAVTVAAGGLMAQENLTLGQRQEVLRRLENGASALQAVGMNAEAARLIEIAGQIANSPDNRDLTVLPGELAAPVPSQAPGQEERSMTESQFVKHQIAVFGIAHHAYREVEAADAMELVERIVLGREMQLSGRRDDEAQQAIRQIPGLQDQVHLLMRASEIWTEFGNEEKARAVASLAEQIQHRANRRNRAGRSAGQVGQVEGRLEGMLDGRSEVLVLPGPDHQLDGNDPNTQLQVQQIQRQLLQLTDQIDQLQRQLKGIRGRR